MILFGYTERFNYLLCECNCCEDLERGTWGDRINWYAALSTRHTHTHVHTYYIVVYSESSTARNILYYISTALQDWSLSLSSLSCYYYNSVCCRRRGSHTQLHIKLNLYWFKGFPCCTIDTWNMLCVFIYTTAAAPCFTYEGDFSRDGLYNKPLKLGSVCCALFYIEAPW